MKPKTLIVANSLENVVVVTPRMRSRLMGRRFDRVIVIDDPAPITEVDVARIREWYDRVVMPSMASGAGFTRMYQQDPFVVTNPCPDCDAQLKTRTDTAARLYCSNPECNWRSR